MNIKEQQRQRELSEMFAEHMQQLFDAEKDEYWEDN